MSSSAVDDSSLLFFWALVITRGAVVTGGGGDGHMRGRHVAWRGCSGLYGCHVSTLHVPLGFHVHVYRTWPSLQSGPTWEHRCRRDSHAEQLVLATPSSSSCSEDASFRWHAWWQGSVQQLPVPWLKRSRAPCRPETQARNVPTCHSRNTAGRVPGHVGRSWCCCCWVGGWRRVTWRSFLSSAGTHKWRYHPPPIETEGEVLEGESGI